MFVIFFQIGVIDEDIIASAKRIIIKTSKKESQNTEGKSKEDDKINEQIKALLNIIKQQETQLSRVEQKVDMLLTNR